MTDRCTTYRTPVENDFYTELFATDYGALRASTLQKYKTYLLTNVDGVEQWMYYLIEKFSVDNELDPEMVSEALSDKFIDDMKAEFDKLREFIGEDDE